MNCQTPIQRKQGQVNTKEKNYYHSSSKQDNDDQSTHSSDAERLYSDRDCSILKEPESSWETTTVPIPMFDSDKNSIGVKINIDENSTPLDVFEYLFMTQIFILLNDYGELQPSTNRPKIRSSRSASCRSATIGEMKGFLVFVYFKDKFQPPTFVDFFPTKTHFIFTQYFLSLRVQEDLNFEFCAVQLQNQKEKKNSDFVIYVTWH